MIPLNSIKRSWIAYLFIASVFVAGCSSKSGECRDCTDTTFVPNVSLKMVDRASGQDLFFGSGAKYIPAMLKIRHVQHGKVDSIPADIKVDTANHLLNIKLVYQNDVDTIAFQVGTQKPQVLYLGTGILNSCCTRVIVASATYNGAIIFKAPDDPKKQAKMANVVTVPL